MGFEVSGMTVLAARRGLSEAGLLERIREAVDLETRAVLDAPTLARWFPGVVLNRLWEAVVAVAGSEALESLNLRMTRHSFGPIVQPLLKVALALGGRSPATLLARLPDALKVALRGVEVSWTASSSHSGCVTITYPLPMPPAVVQASWRGVLRFSDDLTDKPLRFDRFDVSTPQRFAFQVSWDA